MAFVFDLQGLAVADILQRRTRKQSKSPASNEVMFDPGFRAEKVRRDKLHRRGKKRSKKLRSRVWPGFPSSAMRCEEVTVTALRPKLSSGNNTGTLAPGVSEKLELSDLVAKDSTFPVHRVHAPTNEASGFYFHPSGGL